MRRQIDLQPFCDDHVSWKYDLSKPFAQDSRVIATNGRILIRTSLADTPALSDERRLPNVAGLPQWNQEIDSWKKWPSRSYFAGDCRYDCNDHACPDCYGIGGWGNVHDCETCQGCQVVDGVRGEEECTDCRTGHKYDFACGRCKGTGWTTTAGVQQVGGIFIQSQYDARLRKLNSDIEFAILDSGEYPCLRFRGDGFDGLLMGLARK